MSEHGTYAGAARHWRDGESACPTCLVAARRQRKHNKYLELLGTPASVSSLGTVRRLRALNALGYGIPDLARRCGLNEKTLRNPLYRGTYVYRATADAVTRAYDELSMTVPVGPYATRQRRRAARLGWLPPLMWDDPDTDPEPPGEPASPSPGTYDPAVVERILGGDWGMDATAAERREVLRRWLATGRPGNELARLTGWQRWGRYQQQGAA